MFLFYFSITLAICSSALYHFSARSMLANINFSISLVATYAVALGIVFVTAFFFPAPNGLVFELKQLNLAACSSIAPDGISASPRCWSMWWLR